MIGTRDFVPNGVGEIPEYFVYCGIDPRNSWGKRPNKKAKGAFLEVPVYSTMEKSALAKEQPLK